MVQRLQIEKAALEQQLTELLETPRHKSAPNGGPSDSVCDAQVT